MTVIIDGTAGIANNATDLSYTGTLTGSTGVVNLGSGQVYKDASGNVGIGTSSPAFKLDVANTSDADLFRIKSTATANNTVLRLGLSGNNAVISASGDSTGTLQFNTYGAERARIDSSGNLLVGATAAGTQGARILAKQTTSGGYAVVSDAVSNGGTYYFNAFQINGAAVVGQVTSNGTSTTYATSSDYRLKNTVAPMTGALAKVALLKPCTYKWNVDGSDGQGFIAHELQEVVEGCVTGEKDAVETYTDEDGNEATRPVYQGIDTSFLVATLTAALQEAHGLIKNLEQRVAALEAV